MQAKRENIVFVLVRPLYLGNIGSVARVLKNFNFAALRLVDPPRNYKDAEARRMSAGAFDVLKNARVYATLSDALKDVTLAAGTTAGHQRALTPKPFHEVKDAVTAASQSNRVAWIFGDERNGLTKEELDRCHHVTSLPANPEFPSLNVAQAVGIIAYVMSGCEGEGAGPPAPPLPDGRDDDDLFARLEQLLDRIEFSRRYNRDIVLRELRCVYQRMVPTRREHTLLKEIVRKINQKLGDK
ncbi:MAG TPA: TrmJ/YjtD family RNA methyltransferase [Candidatus Obscuribacterales bacterium]